MSRDTKVIVLLVLVVIGALVVLRWLFMGLFYKFWWIALVIIGIYVGYRLARK